eukprot:CAMPEP_0202877626 /NCGR_PEP_ID=MMETSP1391-20130828/30949_1 /ASSEMBLY_ACC=CAM_ASM_000867 /TAXON_ID=1034604 /ORGANISM="Chlamydomonas leiostraca, Strain SAG 11-49" /LENGTH=158 /DNA_ID=CAMNT_0049559691 /DNA_START=118 /DNA_END=591 /DNA_ORIENTATION=+
MGNKGSKGGGGDKSNDKGPAQPQNIEGKKPDSAHAGSDPSDRPSAASRPHGHAELLHHDSGSGIQQSANSSSQIGFRLSLDHDSRDKLRSSTKALNEKTLSEATSRLIRVQSRDDFKEEFHAREVAAAAFKRDMATDWLPEYRPASIIPPERTPDTVL